MVTSLSLGSVVSHSANKRILLAEPRGYCAGVDRAIDTVVKALERYGAPIYVRREIVHNKHVITTLAEKGAVFVDDIDNVPVGQRLVFSAHGVAPTVRERAAQLQLHTIDATCPLVTKVHNEVKRFAKSGYTILLIGHPGHEEVEGTAGEAPESVILIDTVDTARSIVVPENTKLIWLSQTTLSVDETAEIVAHLKQRFNTLEDPPSDDICYATQNRQSAVKMMAPLCDVVIVVGSTNSSNSVRLVEVALQSGAKAAYLVDYHHEIDDQWLVDATTIGVTSGASVPEILVEGVVEFLVNHGFDSIEYVNVASESLVFSLPRELRSA